LLKDTDIGYWALSYVWGDVNPIGMILLEEILPGRAEAATEQPKPKEFFIRQNLYEALRQLRSQQEVNWFWIDALCIDQNSDVEKSHQLPKMLDIYSNAWSVHIWLGAAESVKTRGGTDALDFIFTIVNLKLFDRMIMSDDLEETVASFIAFGNILRRSWFRRRWVIQEISASQRASVQCGSKTVNWIDFADAVQLFLDNVERIRKIYDRSELSRWEPDALAHVESVGAPAIVRAANNVLKKDGRGRITTRLWNLESLVMKFLHFESTDPRDTIFALLSLASDEDDYRKDSPPNYSKDAFHIYAEFVEYCIVTTGSLDVICRHWALPLSPSPFRTFMWGSAPQMDPLLTAGPSWIGFIAGSPFGPPSRPLGRVNGDSLVGLPS
jgi:hypothetical protein